MPDIQKFDSSAKLKADERSVPPNSVSNFVPEQDLDRIWSWNASIPPPVRGCVHDLITEMAQRQPDAPAVCAWDGDFTYSQLDSLANLVAQRIIKSGIKPKSSIPILCPKSRWTCIAMLGVIKAGCSAIALDGTQPDTRLRSIVHQTQPRLIISSATLVSRAALLMDVPVLQLDDTLLNMQEHHGEYLPSLPSVSPSDIVYISFTSGTTGQPKGACISHSNVRSTVHYQGEKLGFHRGARVFDFAPYSFDVAWSNFLHTLCAGGCLCIASESHMVNDLSSAITAVKANFINITPTVLRTIAPVPPTLETVLLSGEMPYRQNVTEWAGRVRLLNTYGPTECTFKCAFSILSPSQEGRPDIGTGVGFSTWLVDPDNSDQLVPIGSVGELYLEGPMVGQGYLSDPEKTAMAFVKDPKWLVAGSSGRIGRHGRLYKTGDLVKYKPDGRLLFVGRKDSSQLKIRGQRVELGDVEHHIRACLNDSLPIIVDVIQPLESDSSSLAMFVSVKNMDTEWVKQLLDDLADKLRDVLPAFMIPSIYLPIEDIPVASTGKVDRRSLREMGSTLSWKETVALQSTILTVKEFCAPSTDAEKQLSTIWAEVLDLDPGLVSTTDNFLRLGGDSVAAMRAVAKARESKLSLAVADLFRSSTLRDLARMAEQQVILQDVDNIMPFSLLTGAKSITVVREEAANLCGVDVVQIEDVYPCTPLQQGMLAMTNRDDDVLRHGGDSPKLKMDYVSRTAFELPNNIDMQRLQKAWEMTVAGASILRTRIVDMSGEGLVQIVVAESHSRLQEFQDIHGFMQSAQPMGLGTLLCRAGVIRGDPLHFILEMHHAIFDGWCTTLLLDALEAAYQQNEVVLQRLGSFQPFIKHVLSTNTPEAAEFWKSQFAASEATIFPSPGYLADENLDISHQVANLQWPSTGITPSSVLRSALALLLASYTNSSDVKYGATVSGRQAPVSGIHQIAGPTIATIPVRTRFNWESTAETLLQQVQQQAIELSAFEQFGLQRIQRAQEDNEEASQFQILLVIQPAKQGRSQKKGGLFSQAKSIIISSEKELPEQTIDDAERDNTPLKNNEGAHETLRSPALNIRENTPNTSTFALVTKDGQHDSMGIYNSYAMLVTCQLEDSGLTLKINFDSGAIKNRQAQHFAHQFEHLVRQLCSEQTAKLSLRDIASTSEDDLKQIFDWNSGLTDLADEYVTDIIDQHAVYSPDAIAISSWDMHFTYEQLENASNRLAYRLQQEGVGPGSIIVLNVEKSAWMPVSMISALKIGAIVLPMSAPTSQKRVQAIVENLQPTIAIVSNSSDAFPFQDLMPALPITELVQFSDEEWVPVLPPRTGQCSDPALVLFTSGSTGTPKSILWSHKTLSSNIQAASSSFNITASTRAFQFAGYEFDVSTVESLATLSVGGCLCIPSESDRKNRLSGAINDSEANWLCSTPSVSETLIPEELPLLKTIVFAGEKLQRKTAFRWAEKLDTVYNWYGPAEASVATSYSINEKTWRNGIIGTSRFGATWLVDPKNPGILAAIGTVAELCIEGPLLASYAGKDGLTLNQNAFFSPAWLPCRAHEPNSGRGLLYRTGDLVKYDSDGSILFISRKQDSQRKIRGQRIDLNEVEICVQTFLAGKLDVVIVAEIVSLSGSGSDTLVLFISPTSIDGHIEDVASFVKQFLPAEELELDLSNHLPSHMIPKVYISIDKLPMNHSGKTDRKRLRLIGSSLTHEELASMQPLRKETRKPSGDMEMILQQIWSDVIGIESKAIYANDSFFRLGGDSITAMRLVASARKQGFLLTVADVFEAPQLEKMAFKIKHDISTPEPEVRPFSLLAGGINVAESRSYVARLCSVSESQVVDIYPCTSLQQGLLALGTRKHGQYVSRSVLALQAEVDTERLQRAWLATVEKLPILRTRIIDVPHQGLVQVVLNATTLRSGRDVESYICDDELEPMGLGTELCRVAIIDRNFIFTIHHCTYDGDSLRMILDEIESQYLGKPGLSVTPFQHFIKHLAQVSHDEAAKFWEDQLANLEPRQFPLLPSSDYRPQANEDLEHSISLEWPRTGITPSTLIRSSWTILAAQYTLSSDVMFGLTVSGRQANLRGIENCVGPTISTVPVAISVNWNETIEAFLERSQHQMIEITPYEQFGLQNIQRLHNHLDSSMIQTLLVVQPVAEGKRLHEDNLLFKARSFSSNLSTQGSDPFNTYALMIICELASNGLRLRMSFDSAIINKKQMHLIACQFETILRQLSSESMMAATLDAIQTASDNDLDFIWSRNAKLPRETNTCVHDMITTAATANPDKIVIDAWDGRFSYQQVEDLSNTLCQRLMQLGALKGSVIALSFEKSKWTAVAQVAVFKTGAVSLLQSIAVPENRIATVYKNANVKLAVASESRMGVVSKYVACFTIEQLLAIPHQDVSMLLPALEMHDPAAILVSSGSTGEPKQILWSHRAIAGNIRAHSERLSVNEASRIFQFASYDFDLGTIEVMSALANLGCVCIPSETQRLDGLSAAINSFGVNHINITPSTAKLLSPEDMPNLSTLVFAGENLTRQDIDRWKGKSQEIINWYGPAECATATFCAVNDESWRSGVIGRIDSRHPSLCWLVDPGNYNKLVPFGAVGEIALEGPMCAEGYLGNQAKTDISFCRDPRFLEMGDRLGKSGRPGRIYRTGDLAKYDTNGDLIFLGRKDFQLKLRGQLVAPQEVEHSIRQYLMGGDEVQVVVDAVVPKHSGNLTLVAFVNVATQDAVESLTAGLNEKLKAVLPGYAIPSYYIPVPSIPTTQTGKRDRARLLEIGADFNPPRQETDKKWIEPSTLAETKLRELWSLVLGIDATEISANDSFLRIGDSIQAMRLVGMARQQDFRLTVAEIFQHPILLDMAKYLQHLEGENDEAVIGPYTLLHPAHSVDFVRQQAASLCGITKDNIEDLFPCTPLQEGLLALTVKHEGDYTGRNVLRLNPSVDAAQFKKAWQKVVSELPVLRTRIIDLPEQGLLQVVIREHDYWTEADNIEEYIRKEKQLPMGLGTSLMRCGLIPGGIYRNRERSSDGEKATVETWYFVLTMHHSIYDGLTTPLIFETLEKFYNGKTPLAHSGFQLFVKYMSNKDKEAEASFWKDQFQDLEAVQFPALPSPAYQPRTNSILAHSIKSITWRMDDITPSTVIRAAFALLCSQYSNSTDVVFGTVVDGRKAPVKGIERLVGPTIATVPIRAKVGKGSIADFLRQMQHQATEMIPYEQMGLSAIRLLSDEAQQACQFQTFLVIQPQEQNIRKTDLFDSEPAPVDSETEGRYHGFNSYAFSLVATLVDNQLKLEFCFDSAVIENKAVQRMATNFEILLKCLCSENLDSAPVGDITIASDEDLNEVWKWNSNRPESIERCVHHLIEEVAQVQPDAIAISAWDGNLSYELLDRLANAVAHRLVEIGVTRNMIIPICSEKSKFAMVAFLGVIKAGGAALLLDPTLPDSRLKAITEQVNPLLILSSALQEALSSTLSANTLVVGDNSSFLHSPMSKETGLAAKELPLVDPSDLLYAIFTSGSTGTPKGCLMQHRNFSSAVLHQRSVLRLNNNSRMYDFSSYAFDASYWGAFHVLSAGGTLCIPSDTERKNNLTKSIREFRATDIFLTPSTARLIDSSLTPTLRNVHLGGEEVTKDDVARWLPYVNTFVSYGPAECSAGTLYYNVPNPMPSRLSIGKPVGVAAWVVDPESSDRLLPIGSVGELYLEGALVGKGYLADKEKTELSFIESPRWLLNGSPDGAVPGRSGRLYKTGDLVKYNPNDGTFVFVGRKDTQVKLRGQRIELSEVEHHVRSCLLTRLEVKTAVAEIITPNVTGRATLVVFMELQTKDINIGDILDDLEHDLRQRLPSYMVPTSFIILEYIPLGASGKTDRKRLRHLGSTLTLEQLARLGSSSSGESQLTEAESRLQQLWMAVLGIPADRIRKSSSFLRLGGDSISAMRLTSVARSQGVSLTVQHILEAARLSEMAKYMTYCESGNLALHESEVLPFSLLKSPSTNDQTFEYISRQCGVDISQIEDVFPCTGVQKSLLSMTAKSDNSYVARFSLRLRNDVDIGRLQDAWQIVSLTTAPILRYRIVDAPSEGLVQVQIKESIDWNTYESIESYLEQDQMESMGLSKRLTRLAIVEGPSVNGRLCLITQHHAIYDGYSLNLLLTEVSKAYTGVVDDGLIAPFQQFIRYIMKIDHEEARKFWSDQFSELEAIPFPTLPHKNYQPKADSTVRRHVTDMKWQNADATASTIIRTAWSILTARYTDSNDVIFGAMVTGRQAPLVGLDRMIAPLINAVPVRVKIDPKETVDRLLQSVQTRAITTIAYEQTELLDIRRINIDAERASRFNTLLVVQPPGQTEYADGGDGLFQHRPEVVSTHDGLDDFNPNAVMIMCQLTKSNDLKLEISFDSNVIDLAQMERVANQFEHVLRQICSSTTQAVEDIDLLSTQDMKELWNWNGSVPAAVQDCVHDMIGVTMKQQPQATAICSWDGSLSYSELDDLSYRLAAHLVALGVKPGSIIPLCFEKSMWYPVAALGAMRAGGACIAMDSTQPESRLRSIVQQVNPKMILSSVSNEALANRLSDTTVVSIDHNSIPEAPTNNCKLPKISPSDILYVVFTSGSTGVPKGILTTHENFASAATHQKDILHIREGSRVFDFVSYSFDVSWSNHLQTLICGGCLCIPSEWERKNDIAGAFNRMKCDYVYFTPSVARSQEPSSMPGIRTLAMGGEPIQNTEISRWTQAETIIGIYGPAECAQALSFARLDPKTRNNHVGRPFGARTWLVQPGRPDRLAAIGTVGELMIEGPTVSKGYFGDVDKTKASYIQDPTWLARGTSEHSGRSGILYKTGDLLRYNSDGSMDFLGRKDGLIKLRGQRIELAEVEYHVRSCLGDPSLCDGVAAEIILPQNSLNPILAVFLSLSKENTSQSEGDVQSNLRRAMEGLDEKLWDRVPQYMVPGAYIHVEKIPMTTTNKTDRRSLRELGSKRTLEQLAELQSHGKVRIMPSTPMEKRLQALWSSVLEISAQSIGAESSFLRIGGESIAAMRLVSAAREQNLSLTVADIFKAPHLSELALLAKEVSSDESSLSAPPFSLLESDDPQAFLEQFVKPTLNVGLETVKDVIPATDFQERSILDALQDPPNRYPHWIFDLPADVDFLMLEHACFELVNSFDILHTVFIRAQSRFWQVLLSDFKPIYDHVDANNEDMTLFINTMCEQDLKRPRQLGRSFIRFVSVKHASGKHKLVFRISHAQFDGFSWGLVLQALSVIYKQQRLPKPSSFAQFISFSATKKRESKLYWASRLQGSLYPAWSLSDSANDTYTTDDRLTMKKTIPMPNIHGAEGFTPAVIFHAACAIALARQFEQQDVVFGRLVTGRSMLPSHLQNVVGPCMTEVPIRASVATNSTLVDVASQLQGQFIEDSTYEAAGMVEIIRNCTNWPENVMDFGWRTSFQQEEDTEFSFLGSPSTVSFYERPLLPRNRPEIYATPREENLDLEFEGNRKLISETTVMEFLAELQRILATEG